MKQKIGLIIVIGLVVLLITNIVIEKIAPEGYVKESSPITITVEKYFDETTNKFEVRILNSKITNAEGKEYEYFEDGDSTFVVGVPNIPITGEYKIRGRGCFNGAAACTSAVSLRNKSEPSKFTNNIGFRLVRTITE